LSFIGLVDYESITQKVDFVKSYFGLGVDFPELPELLDVCDEPIDDLLTLFGGLASHGFKGYF
jgi:hypothetical protein